MKDVKSNILFFIGLLIIVISAWQTLTRTQNNAEFFSSESIAIIAPIVQIFLGFGLCALSLFFKDGKDSIEAEIGMKTFKLKKTPKGDKDDK